MSKRPTPEEIADFHSAVQGVIPLRVQDRVVMEPPKPRPRPNQRESNEASVADSSHDGSFEFTDALGDTEAFLRAGLHRKILRDLRRGRWAVQNHIDLHGCNRYEAHEAIGLFVVESISAGKRCVRVVHGRGHASPGRQGVLRQLVKAWLMQHKDVLAFCHPPSSDGGEGALWVLLRAGRKTV